MRFGQELLLGLILLIIGTGGVASCMVGMPHYSVWQQEMKGRAELSRAEQNRQIRIQEAMAGLEAAEYDARSEVARAIGVSEANEIVAEGLGGPEGYLRYLWINALATNGQDVIYIPTEAGLPILEATRFQRE